MLSRGKFHLLFFLKKDIPLTHSQGYTPPATSASEYQPIPLDKVEDFGVHANSYYQLDISIFKSSLDTQLLNSLWNKYWVNTLSQSPLISVRPFPPYDMTRC